MEEPASAYGVKVTASPSYSQYGVRAQVSENTEDTIERYRAEGSRDIYKLLKTGELYSVTLMTNLIDTKPLRYGMELPSGAGTPEKSLNMVYSRYEDNGSSALVEYYYFYLGARIDMSELEITNGVVTLTQNLLCSRILGRSDTHGLTTPTFMTPSTADPWTSITGGSGQLIFPGPVTVDTPRAKITVKQNLEVGKPNGETRPKWIYPTNRDITFEFDTWVKDDVQRAAVENFTNYSTLIYRLNSTGPKDVTMANIRFYKCERSSRTNENKHLMEKLSGSPLSVTVTA